MDSNYQLLNPVLLVISIGLIAYLIYLLSLTLMGSHLRVVENVILISVIIAAVLIVIIMIRQGTKVQERLESVLRKKSSSVKTVIQRELPHHVLKELDEIIMGGKEKAKPREEEKAEVPKEEKAEEPVKEEPEVEKETKVEAKPAKPPKEIPETVREKFEEISRLLKEGARLRDTDVRGAKEAFLRIRDIYNSLPPKDRKIIDKEITKAMESRKKAAEKPSEKKE